MATRRQGVEAANRGRVLVDRLGEAVAAAGLLVLSTEQTGKRFIASPAPWPCAREAALRLQSAGRQQPDRLDLHVVTVTPEVRHAVVGDKLAVEAPGGSAPLRRPLRSRLSGARFGGDAVVQRDRVILDVHAGRRSPEAQREVQFAITDRVSHPRRVPPPISSELDSGGR